MKMKNFKKPVILTLVLLIASVLTPPRANAFLAMYGTALWAVAGPDITNDLGFDMNWREGVLCVIFLPICVLDQKQDGQPGISRQDLVDNGYTDQQADQIIAEGGQLTMALASKKERLMVGASDTAASLGQQIRSVLPSASDTFVDFYVSQASTSR